MTDIDTGLGPFPTPVNISGGGYFYKSVTANATARPWGLFADSRGFFFSSETTTGTKKIACFTDFSSEKSGDAFATTLCCATDAASYINAYGYSAISSLNFSLNGDAGGYLPRSYTQLGSAVTCAMGGFALSGVASGHNSGLAYPSPASNGLIITPFAIREIATSVLRSLALPGAYATPQAVPLTHGDKVINVTGFSGRKLMAISVPSSGAEGRIFIDITGPWR